MSEEKGPKSGESDKERRTTGAMIPEKPKLLIAHGDLDGIVSAALLAHCYGLSKVDTKLVFTQPFKVDSIEIEPEVQEIWVVDIAVNHRDPEMTKRFLKRIREKSAKLTWFDHHKGWSKEIIGTSSQVVYEEKPSCAEIIRDKMGGDSDLSDLVSDATVADTRKGELDIPGHLINEAIKADLSDDSVRESAVWWIVNGSKEDYRRLQVAQEKYQRIQQMTEELIKKYKLYNGIAIVDVRDVGDYNLTELLIKGEEMAPKKTAVVLWKTPEGEEILTIATMGEKNLVDLFGLQSGSPSRVTLLLSKGWTLERVLEILRVALSPK